MISASECGTLIAEIQTGMKKSNYNYEHLLIFGENLRK